LSFIPHIQHLRNKINALSGILRKTIREEWRRKAYLLLYKRLYVPVIIYGAVAWFERISHSHIDRILNSIQMKLLISMPRACRTSSIAEMQIIVGCMPLKLEITKKAILTKVRWKEMTNWTTYLFNPEDDPSNGFLKKEKEKLEIVLLNQWQRDWDANQHGMTTYRFIPDVTFCERNSKWFRPNKPAVDMITGYGSINQTLYERNCVDSPDCPRCSGVIESVEHMLFECPLYNNIRHHDIFNRGADDTLTSFLENEENFKLFYNYVTKVFKCRKVFIQTENGRDSPPPRG